MPESVYRESRSYFAAREPKNASDLDDKAPRVKTADPSRGNHEESRNSYARPNWRSSTSRGQEWGADDYSRRYEKGQIPSRSVRYADDDAHDRGQGASASALHPTLPKHMRSHSSSQMVKVRPGPRASGPAANVDVPIVWRPDKVASTKNNPNDQKLEYEEARNDIPKLQRDSQHVPGLFQTVFDLNHAQDATTHLELLITDDHETELEEFSQLHKLGNLGAARDYFQSNLEPYLNNPYVFVQYGQMLLDQGDYLALEDLNPEAVFGKEVRETLWYTESVEGWYRNLSRYESRSRSRGRALGARTEAYHPHKARDVYYGTPPIPPPRRPRPPPQPDKKITDEHRYPLPKREDARRSETESLVLRDQDVEGVKPARSRSRSPSSEIVIITTRKLSWSSSRSPTPPAVRDGSRRRGEDYNQERRRSRSRETVPERARLGTRSVERLDRSPSPPSEVIENDRVRFVDREPSGRARCDFPSPVIIDRPFRRAKFEPGVRHSNGSPLQRSRSLDSVRNYYDPGQDDESISIHSNGGSLVQDTEPSSNRDDMELLRQNWRLLKATTNIHRNGNFGEACSEAWYAINNFKFGPKIGSTELCAQIGHVLPEWYYADGLQDAAAGWVDWSALFKQLLIEGRIWDFKDLYVAVSAAFSDSADKMLFGTRDIKCSLHDDWVLDEDDESTNLAQLGILLEPYRLWPWCLDEATSRAEAIVAHTPKAMKSRPFTRWIIEDVIDALRSQEQSRELPWHANETRLQGFPGVVWQSQSTKSPSTFYVPKTNENPGWIGPMVPAEETERIQLALNLAKELKDYKSQAECYRLLIQMSQDPTHIFQELAQLQNETQGDKQGHLVTLLSSYLICKDRSAQERLLKELQKTTDQGDATTLWARDFIERAVKRTLEGPKSTARLRKPASFYMDLGLSREVEQFIWQNAEHDPPPSRYETSLLHLLHGPVPLQRRPAGAQGQVKIRPFSNLRSYDSSKKPLSRLDAHQQASTYVEDVVDYTDSYGTRRSSIEAERRTRQENPYRAVEIKRQAEEQDAKYIKGRQAQEFKDRRDREHFEELQLAAERLRDFPERQRRPENRGYQDRLVGKESGRRSRTHRKNYTDSSDTSSERDGDASFNDDSHNIKRQQRKVTGSDKEEEADQRFSRTRGNSDEEQRSELGRDETNQHGDDLESPQPDSRNALVVYSRFHSKGSPDLYIAGRGAIRSRMGRSHNTTTRSEHDLTPEPTKTDFRERTDIWAEYQPDFGSEGDTGKIGYRDPPSLREAESRDHEEPEAAVDQSDDGFEADNELGNSGVPILDEAHPRDQDKSEGALDQPGAGFEAKSGEAGDRDASNVHEGDTCDKDFSDSPQYSRLQPANHQDGKYSRAGRGRLSTSRKRRSESPLDFRGAQPRNHEAEGPLDRPHSKSEADSDDSGDRDPSSFPEAGSRDNNEPRLQEQNKIIADRPPRSIADIAAPTRQKDDWDKITSKEQDKLVRARWENIENKKTQRSVMIDSSPGITRPAMKRSRPGSSCAQDHDGIEPLGRRTSWRDKLAATLNRSRLEAPERRSSLKRSSMVYDADGRPQPIRTTKDDRRAYVGEATSGSQIRVKREEGIDVNRWMLDTAVTAAERRPQRPQRPAGSRSQSTGDMSGRLRRTAPDSSVPERSSAVKSERERDVSRRKTEAMSAVHENPEEGRQSVPQHQQPRSTVDESSKLQASLDFEPGISRRPTVADAEPGDE
ncbi:hypothetical protein N0V82_005553 [Gnomoniopsis sp. IMI 355080]|nr:hypothetical protein N0V82_005553 [Gnomoniopsis sp. IMI 355080]